MRMAAFALALAFFGMAHPHAARAEITYPWCAQYGDRDGARNCGFSTYDQCRAALSGNGGYCEQNPMYRPATDASGLPRKPGR
jgi:uncharacterized protein DUF3551